MTFPEAHESPEQAALYSLPFAIIAWKGGRVMPGGKPDVGNTIPSLCPSGVVFQKTCPVN